jgi:hypothetical protein
VKIFIDGIKFDEPKPLGCTNMTSYPTHFKCPMFHGWARFVPADEDLEPYINNEIDVEIAHERVDHLRMSADRQHQVVPRSDAFSYHVRGEVKTIVNHTELPGNRTTYVVAGDAAFALSLADLGNLRPSEGDTVEFEVHGLSLWDESI